MNLDKLSIDIESSKMARKLRAIARHSNELADELEAIENEWQCDCGSFDYSEEVLFNDTSRMVTRECSECGERYLIPSDDLPTRLEGSE